MRTWRGPRNESHRAEVTGLTLDQAVAYLDIGAWWFREFGSYATSHSPLLKAGLVCFKVQGVRCIKRRGVLTIPLLSTKGRVCHTGSPLWAGMIGVAVEWASCCSKEDCIFGYLQKTSPSSNHTVSIQETVKSQVAARSLGGSRNPFHGKASSEPRQTVSAAVLCLGPFCPASCQLVLSHTSHPNIHIWKSPQGMSEVILVAGFTLDLGYMQCPQNSMRNLGETESWG